MSALKALPSREYKSLSIHWMLGSTASAVSPKSMKFLFVDACRRTRAIPDSLSTLPSCVLPLIAWDKVALPFGKRTPIYLIPWYPFSPLYSSLWSIFDRLFPNPPGLHWLCSISFCEMPTVRWENLWEILVAALFFTLMCPTHSESNVPACRFRFNLKLVRLGREPSDVWPHAAVILLWIFEFKT